jgi:hypothetical protein
MRRLRVSHLQVAVPFAALAWIASLTVSDNSFLWHVRAGTLQLDLGHVLRTDPFSFTAFGEPWRTQSWLAELGYGWLETVTGGIAWVPVMKFLAMSAAIGLGGLAVYRATGRRRGVALGMVLVLAWQASPFAVARPALLGYVLLAAVVAFSYTDRRPLWILPGVFWLWASIHATWAVGLGYLFLDALRRRSRRQVGAVVGAGVATAFTAHGLGTWWILFQFFRNRSALDYISEWKAPDITNPFLLPLLLVVLGIVVSGARGRLNLPDLWIALPFIAFGFMAERNAWPAVLVLAPLAAQALGSDERRERRRDNAEAFLVNWAFAVVMVAAVAFFVTRPVELSEERFPSEAAVAALEPGPQFNGTAVGGYLIYAEWPERTVYIDDRAELYGGDGLATFGDVRAGVGVLDEFAKWGIEQAIVPVDWPVVEYLDAVGWITRYHDEDFVVLASPETGGEDG